jgi:hypothetical protein
MLPLRSNGGQDKSRPKVPQGASPMAYVWDAVMAHIDQAAEERGCRECRPYFDEPAEPEPAPVEVGPKHGARRTGKRR